MNKTFLSLLLTLPLAFCDVQAQPITAGPHTRVETVYGPIEGLKESVMQRRSALCRHKHPTSLRN